MDTRITLAAAGLELFFIGAAYFMVREFKKGKLKQPWDPPSGGADGARLVIVLLLDAIAAILIAVSWATGRLRW